MNEFADEERLARAFRQDTDARELRQLRSDNDALEDENARLRAAILLFNERIDELSERIGRLIGVVQS